MKWNNTATQQTPKEIQLVRHDTSRYKSTAATSGMATVAMYTCLRWLWMRWKAIDWWRKYGSNSTKLYSDGVSVISIGRYVTQTECCLYFFVFGRRKGKRKERDRRRKEKETKQQNVSQWCFANGVEAGKCRVVPVERALLYNWYDDRIWHRSIVYCIHR